VEVGVIKKKRGVEELEVETDEGKKRKLEDEGVPKESVFSKKAGPVNRSCESQ